MRIRDPGWRETVRIRDPGWKKVGSATLLYVIYFMAKDDPFRRAGSLNHLRMWENYLSDENGFWLVAQISAWFS
jgi:hypothetical protein